MSSFSSPLANMTISALARWRGTLALCALAGLAACASPTNRAPVEDRNPASRAAPAAVASAASAPSATGADASTIKPLPGIENAGKPGFYTVKPGDTLIRVALDNGQNWRDVARWNGIDNPNLIEVGQVLRVAVPAAESNGAVTKPVAVAGRVEGKPLDGKVEVKPGVPGSVASAASAASGASGAAPTPPPAPAVRDADEDLNWAWPANGTVLAAFDDSKTKGLVIGGKAGDPVYAAADGRVVYAGAGLRGYGNLIIVKHNATFLTAYAHNQALLVKDEQVVRRGQKIAEMGSSDAERVQVHFEIRRQGRPIDPAKLLPAR